MSLRSVVLLCVLVLGVASAPAVAQDGRGRVRGIVIDARTGQPLARVRVVLQRDDGRTGSTAIPAQGTPAPAPGTIGALTGADGRFDLEAPIGPVTLTVSAVGYSLARQAVIVSAGEVREQTVALTEGTGVYTEDVHVTGETFPRRDPGVPTEQTLTSADLQSLKSLIADDPLRAVQALPGVAATDDLRSEFSIRGSDFRHIGVALDGIPSPLLVHTVHGVSDGGSLAMINSDILDSVTVSAGSYPQRFGDRTGAFVDFRTRDGARDRVHARVSVSAVNASATVEGPIGHAGRGSWLIAARQSYADWIVKRIDPDVTGAFSFTDAQGKVAYTLSPRHTLNLNVVAGRSRFDERQDYEYGLNSLDVGLNRAGIASVSLRSELSSALTVTQRLYGVAGEYRNLNPVDWEVGRGSTRDLSYRVDASQILSPRLLLEAGGHLQWQRASGHELSIGDDNFTYTRGFDGSASRQSAYGLLRWEPNAQLLISPGARVDRWTQTNQTQASPWLQTEWRLPRAWTVSAGGGLYRQAPELDEVFGPRGSLELRTARAWQGDAGLAQQVGAWRWQITAFVRDESDGLRLPESEPKIRVGFVPPSFLTRYQNAIDTASHGVEVMLHRRGPNGLSGWIGYAYADTEAYDVNRYESYAADVDQRHTFHAYGRYRISDRLSVSSRFRLGSNTPIVGYLREQGGRYFVADQRNLLRLPTYTRLDLRADQTLAVGRRRLTLFLEVVNAYNRRNERAVTPQIFRIRNGYEALNVTEKLFPIIPSLGLTVEF